MKRRDAVKATAVAAVGGALTPTALAGGSRPGSSIGGIEAIEKLIRPQGPDTGMARFTMLMWVEGKGVLQSGPIIMSPSLVTDPDYDHGRLVARQGLHRMYRRLQDCRREPWYRDWYDHISRLETHGR